MKNKKILVAGDVMLDTYHFGKVDRISPEAPVPVFLETKDMKDVPGGAANVAVNISAIGVKTLLFSAAGFDEEHDKLIELLEQSNIQVALIKQLPNKKTTSKRRYIGPNNQQLIRIDKEDKSTVSIENVKEELAYIEQHIGEIGIILLSDYKKGFLTEEIAGYLISLGKSNSIPVLIDIKNENVSKYKGAYLLKPNKKELSEITKMNVDSFEQIEKATIKLCNDAECEYVLTTLGAEGMLLTDREKSIFHIKSSAKEIFDVTGAGDTVIAYLASELLYDKSIIEAIETANYAAGVQVSKLGTSIVYPYEVEKAAHMDTDYYKRKKLDLHETDKIDKLLKCKENGKRVVFTNGCFDILHAGHITYLKKARELGDILIIGINNDASVKRLKGKSRPLNSLEDRCLLLSALEFVDFVIPFGEDTPGELIKKIMPDVLVKGGDYEIDNIVGKDFVQGYGGEVRTIPLVEGKSTTKIINKIQEGSL